VPFSAHEHIVMKPEEFRLLRDLIAQKTGISFGLDARSTLERRLRDRLLALSLPNFAEYFQYLRFNPRASAEWDEAIEVLTTNETYFYREDYQLRAFKTEVLPMLAAQNKNKKSLSIWSAGCSTGEEVYTIAILVFETRLFDGWDIRVFGSDISRRCVATARAGVYGSAAFRTTSPEAKRAYFAERTGGVHVHERIREMCQFGQLNLLDDQRARLLGKFDAIFCRNVLIYFDAHARRCVIDMFLERLNPGGVLLLGHSESLLNVSTAFELLHLKEDLVYRKPSRTGVP